MVSRVRRGGALIAVAALTVIAAGCGDDESGDDAAAAPTNEESAESSDSGTVAAAESEAGAGSDATDASNPGVGGGEVDRSDWPDKLVMGAVPSEESTALQQSYGPLLQVLEEDLGIEIEFFEATEYAGIIEAQIAGDVDIAGYGPFSYVLAKTNGAEIEPVGAMIEEKGAEPGYRSYGITQGDNEQIEGLEDFEGKDVCFVDAASTSGFLYPSAGLLEAGVDPEQGVNSTFAGGHDASAISVANGDCQAGFAFDDMVDTQLIENGDIAQGDLKVVWKSKVIPGSPLAISLDLPESLRTELERTVLEEANVDRLVERGICESADTCSLTDENGWGYTEVDDTFYDGVRSVCRATKSEACRAEG